MTTLGPWLATRSPRERRLLVAALLAAGIVAGVRGAVAVRTHFALARARLAAEERDLASVRQLARELARAPVPAEPDDTPLVARVEAVTADTIGRERIASMTPLAGDGEAISVRLVGPSLADAVRLLHALAASTRAPRVRKLDMIKHPDDPARFDVVLEVEDAAP